MLRRKAEDSMQYSNDLRRKLVEAWLTGESTQVELADLFHVSLGWVEKVLRRWRTTVVSSSLCKQIFLCLLFLFTKPSVGSALPTEEQNGSGLLSSSATSPTFSRRCAAPNTTTSWPILHSETNRAF